MSATSPPNHRSRYNRSGAPGEGVGGREDGPWWACEDGAIHPCLKGGEVEHARASDMTNDDPSALANAAAGLREVLRLAKALGGVTDEGELFELICESSRDKLGCKVCAVAENSRS